MNYIILGTSIIVVGAGIYYLVKKARKYNSYPIDYKETDVIKFSDIGDWLKTLDVDIEDFGKSCRIYIVKNITSSLSNLNLSNGLKEKLEESSSKKVLAFVLSDMNNNTKNVLIVIGNLIDDKFKAILHDEITEINLK